LNFAPVVLNVPSGVDVRKVDLSIELQILAFHAQRRGSAARHEDSRPEGVLNRRRLDGVPAGDLGMDVAAELGGARLDVAAGLAAADSLAGDTEPDYGTTEPNYRTGAQAVGT